ncbi:hypothetical protein SEEC0006_00535 [Salmonella enterica subsp. enterica serovar Choleraesuis str. 0006]|nr:hypothetical protein SEEC0006_00535 [Salmonella enterica subsp. enterica serovar Choleraesuis str. 0006]
MMEFKKIIFWHVSVIIIGLVIGLVHHIYIYPNFFTQIQQHIKF